MKWLKKGVCVVTLLLTMIFLVGFGTKEVKLWNNAPLIDLDAAIKNADIGKQGNQVTKNEETDGKIVQEKVQKVDTQVVSKEPVIMESNEMYQVVIQGESIKFENESINDIEKLESLIEQNCTEKSTIILTDDYAETHVYHQILRMIEEQKQIIGFEFQQN